MQDNKKVAVIGASGVVGRAMLDHLVNHGIDAVGLSRRPPADLPDAPFVELDLLQADQCKAVCDSALQGVTHVVYAALYEKPGLIAGWQEEDQMQTNLAMIRNLLDPLRASGTLRHVTLLQGTKAYGAHVAPMRIPGRESEPRHNHANFYWLQEDFLREVSEEVGWQYTIWRPVIIFGHALRAPMNMLAAIGVYAALEKSRGNPLSYPGGPSMLTEAVDTDLLASAMAFAFDNPDCAGETFNITNGDVCRWPDLWPALAKMFEMSLGEPLPRQLSSTLYDAEEEWQAIVNRYNLQSLSIREIVGDSFFYADALFNAFGTQAPPPALLSTIKLRQAGFHDCIDTEEMLAKWFDRLQQWKILPRFSAMTAS